MKVSFVVPVHDEAGGLEQLLDELVEALARLGGDGEILLVDDASADATPEIAGARAASEPRLRVLRQPRRCGQSAALAAGFAAARGEVIVTLDGDLQNDPRDAPALVAALAEADLACGERVRRQDGGWRRFSSRIANAARTALLGDDGVRDTGCGLKAFRAGAARRLVRFDGWHRFFPTLARREGFTVVSLPVSHRPRRHGRTHYGTIDRLIRGLFDLAGMVWLVRRRLPPPGAARELSRLSHPEPGEAPGPRPPAS